MISLTLLQTAELCGAILDASDPGAPIRGVAIDSRSATAGSLFVALAGTRDGHEFLADAYERGAVAALVRDAAPVPDGMAALRVADVLAALAAFAEGARSRLRAQVVAITGSAGKTCTKDFTAAVLSGHLRVSASVASFNNEIGVPLTILAADDEDDVVVAEIGSRGIGHIRAMAGVLRPDVAVVTNVGLAHAGMFGSLDTTARAKAELVESLGPDGCAVLNADDERVRAMAGGAGREVIFYGSAPDATVRATDATLDENARGIFTLVTPDGEAPVALPVAGEHMISNALAAAAVGHRFGMSARQIAGRLAGVSTPPHRMHVFDAAGGWRIIDDAYNASPAAMAAALKTLVVLGRGRRTWAVLGHMAELGDASNMEHDRIGRLAVRLGVGKIVTIGEEARALHEAARLEGMPPDDVTFVADTDAAAKTILAAVEPGDVVLVKASRAAGLERVVEAIR